MPVPVFSPPVTNACSPNPCGTGVCAAVASGGYTCTCGQTEIFDGTTCVRMCLAPLRFTITYSLYLGSMNPTYGEGF